MEDTTIIKQHYAYMFRVDLSCNQTSKLQIEGWLDKYSFTHYLGNHEIGTETKKHHYQMILWREHKFTIKEQTACRNWWRNKTNSKTHGAALTTARKVASLAAYSIKDGQENPNLYLTNLNEEQLSKIPKWQNKSAMKLKNLERLEKALESFDKSLPKWQFLIKLNKTYYEIYGRPLMHRNTYIKYLYKYQYLSEVQLLEYVFNINEFNKDIPGSMHRNNYITPDHPEYTTKDYTLFSHFAE